MTLPAVAPDFNVPAISADKHVFLIGVTGFMGGAIFTRLLALPHPPRIITLLVRDEKKVELLRQFPHPTSVKINVFQGVLTDHEKIAEETEKLDIVINAASTKNLPVIKAIVEGSKRRKEKTQLIQCSGFALYQEDTQGEYLSEQVSAFSAYRQLLYTAPLNTQIMKHSLTKDLNRCRRYFLRNGHCWTQESGRSAGRCAPSRRRPRDFGG